MADQTVSLTPLFCGWTKKLSVRAVSALTVMALLGGCSTLESHMSQLAAASKTDAKAAPVAKSATVQSELPPADFEPDTLYDLLVAEMAAYEQRLDLTLGNYLQQAHKTQDPGLAERAYSVASVVNSRQAAGDAARLWLQVDAGNPNAIRANAVEQVLNGDVESAIPAFVKVKEQGGEAPFLLLAVQSARVSEEIRDSLINQFRGFEKRWPDDITVQIGLAILLQQQGDLDAALEQASSIKAEGGQEATVTRIRAQLLDELERPQQALSLLRSGLETFPNDPRMRLLFGRLLVKSGDLTGAQREFEILVAQQPHNPDLLASVGLIAMENGMPGQAGFYFHRLSKFKGRADEAHYNLGRVAQQMDDWKEGRKHLLKVKPGGYFVASYAALTRMLSDHEQWSVARQDLEKARAAHPEFAPRLYMVEGEILQEQRSYDQAAHVYDKALALYPDDANLLYSRAMLAERMDDLGRLESDLRKIIQKDPENAAALNALGYTLADRTKRYSEARELIDKAYQLRSDDPSIIDSMGWVEFRLGNYPEAEQYLRRAYSLFKEDDAGIAEVAAHLGEVLWVQGKQDEARAVWNKALEYQSDDEILKSTIERLQAADE
ncbi:tetratricopeptide repeat protein [Parendozoicomonas haliclonae]|uniref:Bacteriophage N4 receptor, outer membrane subunit n=1 Tax=Parendozoicomonas haliclonae TaxID=1960125 RepID=A0A1X7AG75_9GAMM|nr:tetratricopeptide repeat protein [Parendozoicomonas haliclonae]SMA32235.1 bacteriophage N4 receptor, outer membrane subunit [Parendozoicomonas haliclonae]